MQDIEIKNAHVPYDKPTQCKYKKVTTQNTEPNQVQQCPTGDKKHTHSNNEDAETYCSNSDCDFCPSQKLSPKNKKADACCSSDGCTDKKKKVDDCCTAGTCEDSKKDLKVISEAEVKKWVKIALFLSIFTIVWNVAEGVISIFFGIEEETIALSIFGADSLIEVASGFVVLWRFKSEFASVLAGDKADVENQKKKTNILEVADNSNIKKERLATRIIGLLLVFLGICAVAGATVNLVQENGPDSSVPGLLISSIAISCTIFLYYFKVKAANILNKNRTLLADAKCSLSCIVLSLVLFFGSLLAILTEDSFDGWWIDSVITILMALLVMKEGVVATKYSFSKDFQGGCPCCKLDD